MTSPHFALRRARRVRRLLALAAMLGAPLGCHDFSPVERVETLEVASTTVRCWVESMERDCLQVRDRADQPWRYFYQTIDGFVYEPGFEYTIQVAVRTIVNPPQDASTAAYRLIAVLRKEPVPAP